MQKINKYRGSLFGLAVGDALGISVEFMLPGSFTPINDMKGGGVFNLLPGEWSDDTSMALCLADSLIESKGFNLKNQLTKYIKWYREGYLSSIGYCFDIGITTQTALINFEKTGKISGAKNEDSAGNGSLMRLAPVALFYANNPKKAIELCGESSKSTHALKVCVDACKYFGGLIVGAVNGVSKEEILSYCYKYSNEKWNKNNLSPEIYEIACGSFKEKELPEIEGIGYVVKSLEAALWCFYKSNSFEEGALLAVNLGNDADTTAAIYGQLAGAYYGIDNIPKKWIEKIVYKDLINEFAVKLYNLSKLDL